MQAFVFPGQGSQQRGMGERVFDKVEEFRKCEREIDAILGYSIRSLCREDLGNRLRETQFTQPSLYVVNALHCYDAISGGETPEYLAGHSLGEYNALHAAGAFDFLTGLRLVKKRGELMAETKNGAMAAVIGLSSDRLLGLLHDTGLGALDVANFNSPTQIVLSGPQDEVKRAGPVVQKAGAQLYIQLAVSAAFHSRYMKGTAEAFGKFLEPFDFHELRIPVIANVTGQPYPSDGASAIKQLLVKQIYRPVLWMQTVQHLIDRGVSTFTEVGPGNVLTRLIHQTKQQVTA
jgi:malonyl CoA-acyl carrier protein transacylase